MPSMRTPSLPPLRTAPAARRRLRLAALALVAAAASLWAASGCALIEGTQDCQKACEQLNQCGVLHSGSCGAYCASLVAGAAIAGCADEFDAQNVCGKDLDACTGAAACAPQAEAFGKCMDAYCKKTPGGQGCP